METGLRHRLRRAARQMASQHEHLRALIQAIADDADVGQIAKVEESVDRLRGAIEAHFSLEDDIFFPALHGLHPKTGRELHALMREHVDGFEAFSQSMAAHERREERLVASLADRFGAIR
jgi:iron-sulfur cluster repair protein YtfE (RIC family)